MTENSPITQENQGNTSLGKTLKQAREALNLSIEDVAKKTNLKKSHIESLENDIFILQNVAPTFVRGYVRNYLRFLRLPEELVSTVNYGEVTIPKEVTRVSSVKASQKSQTQWVKYFTIFVLLAAVGMTLLWWWQDYQKEQENRDQFVISSTPVVTETVAPIVATEPANNTSVEMTPPVVTTPVVESNTSAENANSMANNTASEAQAAEPVVTSVSAEPETAQNTSSTEAVNVLQQNTPETTETETVAEPVAVNNDELRIEITGKESWITVKNTKSKKSLAEKLYANGEVLTFNGNEQYRLTIGAPANVKLYYKGQEVPLKIDGRVARIKLPLAQ